MFSDISILIAVLLAVFSIKEYSLVAFVVAFEFILHELAFQYGFTEYRLQPEGRWALYAMYSAINLIAIVILAKLQCHFAIVLLIGLTLLYNLNALYNVFNIGESITYYDKFIVIYENYVPFMRTIMVLELIYLGWLTGYVGLHLRNNGKADIDHIDRLFRVYGRNIHLGSIS